MVVKTADVRLEDVLRHLPKVVADGPIKGGDVDTWAKVIQGTEDMISVAEYYHRLGFAQEARNDLQRASERPYSQYNKELPAVMVRVAQEVMQEEEREIIRDANKRIKRVPITFILAHYARRATGLQKGGDVDKEWKNQVVDEMSWELADEVNVRYAHAKDVLLQYFDAKTQLARMSSFWYMIREQSDPDLNEYLEKKPGKFMGGFRLFLDKKAQYGT